MDGRGFRRHIRRAAPTRSHNRESTLRCASTPLLPAIAFMGADKSINILAVPKLCSLELGRGSGAVSLRSRLSHPWRSNDRNAFIHCHAGRVRMGSQLTHVWDAWIHFDINLVLLLSFLH